MELDVLTVGFGYRRRTGRLCRHHRRNRRSRPGLGDFGATLAPLIFLFSLLLLAPGIKRHAQGGHIHGHGHVSFLDFRFGCRGAAASTTAESPNKVGRDGTGLWGRGRRGGIAALYSLSSLHPARAGCSHRTRDLSTAIEWREIRGRVHHSRSQEIETALGSLGLITLRGRGERRNSGAFSPPF